MITNAEKKKLRDALVNKLLRLNRPGRQYVEVILLSRNSADTGLRVFNAIKHYGLDISRAAFTKGEPTSRYVPAFGAHLFLSADQGDVRRALDDGHAAATIFPSAVGTNEGIELLLNRLAKTDSNAQVLATLSVLEMRRLVRRLPGHQFVRA